MDDTAAPLVLVVDDDELLRLVIRDLLEMAGYRVAEVADATAGIEWCRTARPDLVLLDALMPEMDGFDCCRHLRSLFPASELPILMLTALSDAGTADRVAAAGATGYVAKPFKTQLLLDRIAALLPSSVRTLT
ncbi:MAG: response regulator [Cyanobacteria bacterium J06639_1]